MSWSPTIKDKRNRYCDGEVCRQRKICDRTLPQSKQRELRRQGMMFEPAKNHDCYESELA